MTTPETGRNKISGFTLIEVIIAFAILLSGLTLVAGLFNQCLRALQFLSSSVSASHLADQQLIQELLSRELGLAVSTDPLPIGFSVESHVVSVQLDQDPLKGVMVNEVTAVISWKDQNRNRITQLKIGFQPPK